MLSLHKKSLSDIFLILLLVIILTGCAGDGLGIGQNILQRQTPTPFEIDVEYFQGDRAYQDVITQLEFGPRIPGSEGHQLIQDWIVNNLEDIDWIVTEQDFTYGGYDFTNITGSNQGEGPPILIGAHYDTRILSDQDPDPQLRETPVPGANDGASGVAVLMELARVIPRGYEENIHLVFFDAEDNGNIENLDWILGSTYYAENLEVIPEVVVIVDMIGDADLNIYYERNSTPESSVEIWQAAADLGYADVFIPENKFKMIDDHIPFVRRGIPGVNIIDFDYEYWHTTADTRDKVSPESLEIVGRTLLHWIKNY